jgi:hypothetical protein
VSLDEAFKRGAVDFKGKKIEERPTQSGASNPVPNQSASPRPPAAPKPKPEIDVEGLRKILDESLKK